MCLELKHKLVQCAGSVEYRVGQRVYASLNSQTNDAD